MSMPMSVIHTDEQGHTRLTTIDVLDVDFIENEGRRFVYHIGNQKYYQITTKSEIEDLLTEHGFDVLDRPYLVNLQKIQHYNAQMGKVYFIADPDKNSKFVTVSRIKQAFVEKFIKRIISHNRNTTMEVSSDARRTIARRIFERIW